MASLVKPPAWLQWVATLIEETPERKCAPAFPQDCFYCLLDDLPLHLIPRGFFPSRQCGAELGEELFLNPECYLCAASELPEDLVGHEELLGGLAREATMAWVRDTGPGVWLPFWLGPRLEAMVRGLQLAKSVGVDLERHDRILLRDAGIVRPAGDSVRRANEWSEITRRCSHEFREKGYAAIGSLMHPFHVAALRRYYRYLIRSGKIRLGDPQCAQRYVAYNEPVARFFHWLLAPAMAAIAGQKVKPSYVYMASYLTGAELQKHVDREQCEFSLTLCLDFSPEPECATQWPIHLETAAGTTRVYQALGDGLCYRGTRVPHYRDQLGAGQTSTSIFFHYVAEDFAGSLA